MANCCVWVLITMLGPRSNCAWYVCGLQGTLCIGKYWCYCILPPLYPEGHMAINADLLKPANDAFYLRGTTRESVPATVAGLSSFPECVAIGYECSGHTQHYGDCPVGYLTFPIALADSAASDRCAFHHVPPASSLWEVQLMLRSAPEVE